MCGFKRTAVLGLLLASVTSADEPAVPVVPMSVADAAERTKRFARASDPRSVEKVEQELTTLDGATSAAECLSIVLRGLYIADESVRTIVDAAAASDWGAAEAAMPELTNRHSVPRW